VASRSAPRVVSLLPSATEIVAALGCAEWLVGITHSCDPPEGAAGLPVLTRTPLPLDAPSGTLDRLVRERARRGEPLYEVDAARLAALAPDVVLTQALCDVCAVPEAAARDAALRVPGGARVVSLTPTRLADVFADVRAVADALGVPARGEALAAGLEARAAAVAARSACVRRRPRVAFLEWLDPLFTGGHWNPELVRLAGGVEVLGRAGEPSRRTNACELRAAEPELLFVACCGLSRERALAELSPALVAGSGARAGFVADGRRHFSRPGPGLVASLELLAHALHPALHAPPAGERARRLDAAPGAAHAAGALP
jgi:iron complex transport system substrate-binding protein